MYVHSYINLNRIKVRINIRWKNTFFIKDKYFSVFHMRNG